MSRFDVHWSDVPASIDALNAVQNHQLLALWPAPVNPDECFKEAGFTDFEDADAVWDGKASDLLARVVSALEAYGPAMLTSMPITSQVPWILRPFRSPKPLPLLEQLEMPMHWDSLPSCLVTFGSAGASLRTGNGHVLMWVTLPDSGNELGRNFATRVAGSHPLFLTPLKWEHLNVA
jgi:hypothetical protein